MSIYIDKHFKIW